MLEARNRCGDSRVRRAAEWLAIARSESTKQPRGKRATASAAGLLRFARNDEETGAAVRPPRSKASSRP